ncbi:MAG: DUF4124 domain-containing protein [Gammaproteobacteria bacterium]|jgi:hypothetical protein
MKHLATLILSCTLILVGGLAHAQKEVYRWVDGAGNVIYSDVPLDPDAQPTGLTYRPTSPGQVAARQQQANAQYARAEEQAGVEAEQAEETAKKREEAARQREIGCAAARKRMETYTTAPRLYETLPDGGRRYLTDDEIDQARAGAMDDVTAWCD